MAFEALVNKTMKEEEILDFIIGEIQANYVSYQNMNVFLKLDKFSSSTSAVVWIKIFPDLESLIDFYYDTKFERSCIMIKFDVDRYEVLCQANFISDRFRILTDKIIDSRRYAAVDNREQMLMIPRDLIDKAFGEINQTLATTKRPKAV